MRSSPTAAILAAIMTAALCAQADAKQAKQQSGGCVSSAREDCMLGAGNDMMGRPFGMWPMMPWLRQSTGNKTRQAIRTVNQTSYDSGRVVAHPAGCPGRLFCGCGVSVRVFGHPVRDLYLAANWLKFPRARAASGMVAWRSHHVVAIEVVHGDGTATVYDPNSGGHLTRIHRISLAGLRIVDPHGRQAIKGVPLGPYWADDGKALDRLASMTVINQPITPKNEPAASLSTVGPLTRGWPRTLAAVQIENRAKLEARSDVVDYLCAVYRRLPVKADSHGDFTWKDMAAAARRKMDVCGYVIGGIKESVRTALFRAGKAMDAAGLRWSILSGFRDDWRQRIAIGYKASACGSLHGGSCVTGGWGDGRAIDLTLALANGGNDIEPVSEWIRKHGMKYGLVVPMPGRDPAHVQMAGLSIKHAKRRHVVRYASR